ncbi:hypothetical protein PsorP6_001531 [Peronosclerospora sorghi]|uniref:Uncharacterized protein n=1 Tax=Peronosclerospora sorghi TaxID=230839 RepID=A0ACC0WUN0_9STRA|nr:hypothetical protein PsorP6_001531 [Peronosclerospora sorghi]
MAFFVIYMAIDTASAWPAEVVDSSASSARDASTFIVHNGRVTKRVGREGATEVVGGTSVRFVRIVIITLLSRLSHGLTVLRCGSTLACKDG